MLCLLDRDAPPSPHVCISNSHTLSRCGATLPVSTRNLYTVSRFVCRSELFEFDLTVDINIDVYPLKVRARAAAIASGSFVAS